MICHRCGYCCREIWPGNQNENGAHVPCPHFSQVPGGVAICDIYSTRSQRCKDERMGCSEKEPCQIGLVALARGRFLHLLENARIVETCIGPPSAPRFVQQNVKKKRLII